MENGKLVMHKADELYCRWISNMNEATLEEMEYLLEKLQKLENGYNAISMYFDGIHGDRLSYVEHKLCVSINYFPNTLCTPTFKCLWLIFILKTLIHEAKEYDKLLRCSIAYSSSSLTIS